MAKRLGANQAKIVDDYCQAALNESAAKKAKEKLKPTIREMISEQAPLVTKEYCLTLTITENVETLDIDAIRKAMPADWIKKFTKIGKKETLKVTKL